MQPGQQSEGAWWWKVAMHLDDAQLALAHAMGYNVDDPRPMQALYERLREGQAILLDIFRAKGLLPPAPGPAPTGPGQHGQTATATAVPTDPDTESSAVVATVQPSEVSPEAPPASEEAGGAIPASVGAPSPSLPMRYLILRENGASEHRASDDAAPVVPASNGTSARPDEAENGYGAEVDHPGEPEPDESHADATDAQASDPDLSANVLPAVPLAPPTEKSLSKAQKKKARQNPGDAGGSSG